MVELSPTSLVRRAPGCRRRIKDGRQAFLIRFADVFELDAQGCALWDCIDGNTPLLEIIARWCQATGRPYGEGAEYSIGAIKRLATKTFVVLQDGTTHKILEDRMVKSLSPVLDRMCQGDEKLASLESKVRSGVVRRFVQICFEMASRRHTVYVNRDTYWRFLAECPERAVELHLHEEIGFKSWRFRLSENKLTMIFDGSTYTGDIDHRR